MLKVILQRASFAKRALVPIPVYKAVMNTMSQIAVKTNSQAQGQLNYLQQKRQCFFSTTP